MQIPVDIEMILCLVGLNVLAINFCALFSLQGTKTRQYMSIKLRSLDKGMQIQAKGKYIQVKCDKESGCKTKFFIIITLILH